jgi:hypothetical protein
MCSFFGVEGENGLFTFFSHGILQKHIRPKSKRESGKYFGEKILLSQIEYARSGSMAFSRDESIKFRLSRASYFINAKQYASDFTFLQLHKMILLE